MHLYGTDPDERSTVVILLAVLSALLSLGGSWLISVFTDAISWELPWFLGPWLLGGPSALAIAGVGYRQFDRRWWRHPWSRRLGLVKIPDFSGAWTASLVTTYSQPPSQVSATVEIKQTWSRISLVLETTQSMSTSITGTVFIDDPRGPLFRYIFFNEPRATASALKPHYGASWLWIRHVNNQQVLEGEYFTQRFTSGEMHLTPVR